MTTVAIVGYTNVGKSTLLNTLTQAGVLAEDKLFATLDPTARALELPDGRKVMLIDTVGLVRRLPHQLVEAFHSTLEEAASADLILSVCDITSPELLEQRAVTERLLEELGVEGTPVITVLNKCDAAPDAKMSPIRAASASRQRRATACRGCCKPSPKRCRPKGSAAGCACPMPKAPCCTGWRSRDRSSAGNTPPRAPCWMPRWSSGTGGFMKLT